MFKNITVFALLAKTTVNARGSRPNILFVFSDDHAVKAISAYGGPLAK
jgi:arylsulfatase A-like enzyme